MENTTEVIGLIAAFLTTAAYIPQSIRVLKTRDTRSISLGMYAMMTVGIACWFVYGIMLNSLSLILANSVTFVMAFTILIMKIRHG